MAIRAAVSWHDTITARSRSEAALRPMTDRVQRLYALLRRRMLAPQMTWGEGRTILDDPDVAAEPLIIRKALAFRATLLGMPIDIEADDLIVGNGVQDGIVVRTVAPRYATPEEEETARREGQTLGYSLAHKTPAYDELLSKGLYGILDEADARVAEVEAWKPSDERAARLDFYRAMRIECQAVIDMAARFAARADELALEADGSRRRELARIAAACRHVPAHPPRSFHEALQSFWFVHYALSANHTQLACGRLDQYLYPAFRDEFATCDVEAGHSNLEEAQELIDCLWMRMNDRAQIVRDNFVRKPEDRKGRNGSPSRLGYAMGDDLRPWAAGHRMRYLTANDASDAVNHWGENILLSGIRPDGGDGTNPLTYLCLNAHEKFAMTSPVLTVRTHRGTPQELIHRAAEVIKEDGGGMPYLNNDDVIVNAYVDLGVPIEDARDYANSNCWETLIQGKSDQELVRGINFLLLLELALHRGHSKVHGAMGPDTGDPRGFATFAQLLDAWKAQADHLIGEAIAYVGQHVAAGTLSHSGHGRYSYFPLVSALTLDCIERGRDVTRCGARYTIWHVMGEALANAVDALAAIKHLVYDSASVTMDALLAAMDANWEGHEALRRQVVAVKSKYANDDPCADGIGRELMDHFVERVRQCAAPWAPDVLFPCSVGTFSWIKSIGREVAASADGRHDYDEVAANMSPCAGADCSGPVAAIQSAAKMRLEDLAAGSPLDLRMSKNGLQGEAGTQRIAGLINGFLAVGGNMMTLTVTDVEELRRAMDEPEKYRHLRVRMGGWSAYWVMLSREQQRVHLKRVEHGLA